MAQGYRPEVYRSTIMLDVKFLKSYSPVSFSQCTRVAAVSRLWMENKSVANTTQIDYTTVDLVSVD